MIKRAGDCELGGGGRGGEGRVMNGTDRLPLKRRVRVSIGIASMLEQMPSLVFVSHAGKGRFPGE